MGAAGFRGTLAAELDQPTAIIPGKLRECQLPDLTIGRILDQHMASFAFGNQQSPAILCKGEGRQKGFMQFPDMETPRCGHEPDALGGFEKVYFGEVFCRLADILLQGFGIDRNLVKGRNQQQSPQSTIPYRTFFGHSLPPTPRPTPDVPRLIIRRRVTEAPGYFCLSPEASFDDDNTRVNIAFV